MNKSLFSYDLGFRLDAAGICSIGMRITHDAPENQQIFYQNVEYKFWQTETGKGQSAEISHHTSGIREGCSR